jgi:hypothetical protein
LHDAPQPLPYLLKLKGCLTAGGHVSVRAEQQKALLVLGEVAMLGECGPAAHELSGTLCQLTVKWTPFFGPPPSLHWQPTST